MCGVSLGNPKLGAKDTDRPGQLVVEGISKSYPRSLLPFRSADSAAPAQALRDVCFAARPGETVGLLGPNGAGKTTLLKIVTTLLYPDSGRVSLFGQDVFHNSVKARGMMGLITCDERSFYWRLTGRHNLEFFATLCGLPTLLARERVQALLEMLNLAAAADQPYQEYSSGMKQKLAIARGLLGDPQLILYDEPTRSLDPLSTQSIHKWILANRDRSPSTIHLIATNQLREAEQLCDRVLILSRGSVIAQGTITHIREQWQTEEWATHLISYRGFVPDGHFKPAPEHGLVEVTIEKSDPKDATLRLRTTAKGDGLSLVLDTILQAGARVLRCETVQVSFDDVFCAIVEGGLVHSQDGSRATGT